MPKVFLSLLMVGLGATSSYAQSAVPPAATVHFYQNRIYGFLLPKVRVYANGQLVCKLGRNTHCQVSLPAGTTSFTATIPVFTPAKPVPVALPLEAGKEYYLESGFATESVIPGMAYGLTEVVANESKRAQLARARQIPAVASGTP